MTIGLNLEKCVPVLGPAGPQEFTKKSQKSSRYNYLHSTLCSKLPFEISAPVPKALLTPKNDGRFGFSKVSSLCSST